MFKVVKNQIVLFVDDKQVGNIIYDEKADYIVGSHVYVDPQERGKGFSSQLIDYFAEFARAKNKKIYPTCPVIKRVLEEKYQDILK